MKSITQMKLDEKIGQMVVCGFHGERPSDDILRLITEQRIGGVIYFSRNIRKPEQVHELSRELQKQAGIPLFIATDQEGGMVARITEGLTLMPGNMAMGAVDDAEAVRRSAEISGSELRALGINMNLAPSLDVNNNPRNPVIGVRSYGDDPEKVASLGVSAVQGYRDAGICAVVKHFPGHGDTSEDSHFSLPLIPHDRERVHQVELFPFKRSIEAGVDAIMTAHVVFPAFDDSGNPATLSPAIINGLLREELGYDGVVMTDCLEMDAVSKNFGTEKAALMAIEAGADIVLISHDPERQRGAIRELRQAVETGRISEARIDESVERILSLKNRRLIKNVLPEWAQAQEILNREESREYVQGISERSITVIKDDVGQIPLDKTTPTFVVSPIVKALNAADEAFKQQHTLGAFLSEIMNAVTERRISANPNEEEIKSVMEESRSFSQVIVVSYNTALFKKQTELIHRFYDIHGTRLIVAAIRNPFDFLDFPQVSTQLASYESRPLALQSLARVLTGEITAIGKLPVHL